MILRGYFRSSTGAPAQELACAPLAGTKARGNMLRASEGWPRRCFGVNCPAFSKVSWESACSWGLCRPRPPRSRISPAGACPNGVWERGANNNLVENAIRPTALGKKNWLFIPRLRSGHPRRSRRWRTRSHPLHHRGKPFDTQGLDPAETAAAVSAWTPTPTCATSSLGCPARPTGKSPTSPRKPGPMHGRWPLNSKPQHRIRSLSLRNLCSASPTGSRNQAQTDAAVDYAYFSDAAGYEKETTYVAIMARGDESGHVIGDALGKGMEGAAAEMQAGPVAGSEGVGKIGGYLRRRAPITKKPRAPRSAAEGSGVGVVTLMLSNFVPLPPPTKSCELVPSKPLSDPSTTKVNPGS